VFGFISEYFFVSKKSSIGAISDIGTYVVVGGRLGAVEP